MFFLYRYHIPRSLLRDDNNTLVVYEEMGGTPMNVKFKTVTIGSICANAYENNTLELSCQEGHTISEIRFASFGDPAGVCGSFKEGSCGAANTLTTIQKVKIKLPALTATVKCVSVSSKVKFYFARHVLGKKPAHLKYRRKHLDQQDVE